MSTLRAAVARTDITPPIGIAHAGWGAQIHQRAAGVDLPLWATALALDDGRETVVIIDVDIGYIWEPEAAAVRDAVVRLTGLPRENVRLSYTHTHSGPINGGTWRSWITDGAEMVEPYDASLAHRLAGVAWAALSGLQPARIGARKGACRINVNRRFQRPGDGAVVVGRNWEGPVDPEVEVVRIDRDTGEPLATVVNYACHPITVGPDNDLITPDYPGAMKRVVEQATGSICLFLQGAAGDVGPIRGVVHNGRTEYKRLAAILGHEASRLWWEIGLVPQSEEYLGTVESGAPLAEYDDSRADTLAWEQDPRLGVATHVARLPLKTFPDPNVLQAEFEAHVAALERLRSSGDDPEGILRETMLCKRSAMRAELARELQGQSHREIEIQAFSIGDTIALLALPLEPFATIGMRVKAASPFPYTLFSGYSNVGWAYIPTEDAYPLGGYEVEITPFSPRAADQLIDECVGLLQQLAGGRSPEPVPLSAAVQSQA